MNSNVTHHEHNRKVDHTGFQQYTPVNQALKQLLTEYTKSNRHPKTETVNLHDAANRVLASDFASPIDVPPFTRSAMDGYAVVASDTKGASDSQPVTLEVVGKTYAGDSAQLKITQGQAVAIATGGRIPQGADAIVMVEYTSFDNKDHSRVKVFKEVVSGKNVAIKGEDLKKGNVILQRGTWLRPQDIGLVASVGLPAVEVFCKPKVAIFSTGSELVEPGSDLKTQVVLYDSNRYLLSCMIAEYGGEAVDLGICKDDEETITANLKEALQYDVVVISGGSSVGERDFVPSVINRVGKPGVLVHGVAMRPGSPIALSIVDGKPVIGAPGYPVACYFAFYTFGRPLLLKMLETAGLPEAYVTAKMASEVKLHDGMRAFLRVKLKAVKGESGKISYLAEPISAAAASIQKTLAGSDGVIIEDSGQLAEGQIVQVLLLRNLPQIEKAP